MRLIRKLAAGAVLVVWSAVPLSAGDLYVGLKTWETNWRIGAADSLNNRMTDNSLFGSIIASGGQRLVLETISIPPAKMRLFGYTLSYIEKDWSVNFAGAQGDTVLSGEYRYLSFADTPSNSNLYFSPAVLDIGVRRNEQDLTLTKLLGQTRFFLFGGIKRLSYVYHNPFRLTTGAYNEQSGGFTYRGPVFASQAEALIVFRTLGPAAGLGYSFALSRNRSLSLSLGGISLRGTLQFRTAYAEYAGGYSGYGRGYQNENLYVRGYTADLTYNILFARVHLFRISLRHQSASNYAAGTRGFRFGISSSSGLSFTPVLDFPGLNLSFHGGRDVFSGLSFAFLVKL